MKQLFFLSLSLIIITSYAADDTYDSSVLPTMLAELTRRAADTPQTMVPAHKARDSEYVGELYENHRVFSNQLDKITKSLKQEDNPHSYKAKASVELAICAGLGAGATCGFLGCVIGYEVHRACRHDAHDIIPFVKDDMKRTFNALLTKNPEFLKEPEAQLVAVADMDDDAAQLLVDLHKQGFFVRRDQNIIEKYNRAKRD